MVRVQVALVAETIETERYMENTEIKVEELASRTLLKFKVFCVFLPFYDDACYGELTAIGDLHSTIKA